MNDLITSTQAAELLGVTRRTLSDWEDHRGLFLFEGMKKASSDMDQWQREPQKIHEMYDDFLSSELVGHVKLLAKRIEAGRVVQA